MCHYSEFSFSVHFHRSNLNFHHISFSCKYICMYAFVSVWFWRGDIIFYSSWQWFPYIVNNAKNFITITYSRDNNSQSKNIKTLSISISFSCNFCINCINVFLYPISSIWIFLFPSLLKCHVFLLMILYFSMFISQHFLTLLYSFWNRYLKDKSSISHLNFPIPNL